MSEIYQKLRKLQQEREAAAAAPHGEQVGERFAESSPVPPAMSARASATASEATPSMAAAVTQMVEHALVVTRFRQDLDDRIASAGVAGVEEVLALSDRLRSGLDRVSRREIEQMEARLDRLREGFSQLGDELQRLRTLKLDLPLEG